MPDFSLTLQKMKNLEKMKNKVAIFVMLLSGVLFSCTTSTEQRNFVKKDNNLSVSSGRIDRYYVHSNDIECRYVDVWIPADYTEERKYAVVYMHDGQMLFDVGNTWNSREWKVDEVMGELLKSGNVRDAIVVGIYNNQQKRHIEYFPEKAIPLIADSTYRELKKLFPCEPLADKYLQFIVNDVKPFVDSTYSTNPQKDHTFLCGSSMGGLISMYGMCEYPEVFGGAACLSTHWIGTFDNNREIPDAFLQYLRENLPAPADHKFYFDHGTVGLDANYAPYQQKVDSLMRKSGYGPGNFQTRVFEGDDHNEDCWAQRLDIPLSFLLK